jgi:hypothetical protein
MESIVAAPKSDRPGLNPGSAVSCSKVYWVMGRDGSVCAGGWDRELWGDGDAVEACWG